MIDDSGRFIGKMKYEKDVSFDTHLKICCSLKKKGSWKKFPMIEHRVYEKSRRQELRMLANELHLHNGIFCSVTQNNIFQVIVACILRRHFIIK